VSLAVGQLITTWSVEPAELRYTLLGPPVPWQRAKTTRAGRRYTDPRMQHAQHAHRWLAIAAKQRAVRAGVEWDCEDREARYELEVVAFCLPSQRGDADNYAKLVADAAQGGVLYPNDRQVTEVIGRRRIDRGKPRTEVRIRRLA
jgi:Holliday junction resolvase RusA-like endonuclease